MKHLSTAEMIRIRRLHEGSLVDGAINGNHSKPLAIHLKKDTPQKMIDSIVQDLKNFGEIHCEPEPVIHFYGIGITPKDLEAGKALLGYCKKNPYVKYVEPDPVSVPESSHSFYKRTLDNYLP